MSRARSVRRLRNPLNPARWRTIAFGLLVAALILAGSYFFTRSLPPTAARYLGLLRWVLVATAALFGIPSLTSHWAKRELRWAPHLRVAAAGVGLLAIGMNVPPRPSQPFLDQLRRAILTYPDSTNNPNDQRIARDLLRSERDPITLALGQLGLNDNRGAIAKLRTLTHELQAQEAASAEARLYEAVALYRLDSLTAADAALDTALVFLPTSSQAELLKCIVLRRLDSLPRALSSCDEAIASDRHNSAAWNYRAAVLIRMQRDSEALAALSIATTIDPADARPWANRAIALWDLDSLHSAMAAADSSLARDSTLVSAQMTEASLLSELKNYPAAIAAYSRLVRQYPTDAEIRLNYGDALFDGNRRSEGLAVIQSALQLKPRCEDIHFNLGEKYDRLGRYGEAARELQIALALEPTDYNAVAELAFAYGKLGRQHIADSLSLKARDMARHPVSSDSPAGMEC